MKHHDHLHAVVEGHEEDRERKAPHQRSPHVPMHRREEPRIVRDACVAESDLVQELCAESRPGRLVPLPVLSEIRGRGDGLDDEESE